MEFRRPLLKSGVIPKAAVCKNLRSTRKAPCNRRRLMGVGACGDDFAAQGSVLLKNVRAGIQLFKAVGDSTGVDFNSLLMRVSRILSRISL